MTEALEPKPAVFLDRDGVLNFEQGYRRSLQELNLFPYARECVGAIHEKDYYAIVITNQSGIARGFLSEVELRRMNDWLIAQTGVDAVYYCPHLEHGTVKMYSRPCHCRKPNTGMIVQACRDFRIDLRRSWFVGDRASDIQTGKNAGVKTVLLRSGLPHGEAETFSQPDYIFDDLRQVPSIL